MNMLKLNKLALAATIALFSTTVFALDIIQDEDLAEVTGQDGVTVGITLPVGGLSWSTAIHDSNGFAGALSAGAIVFGDPLAAGGITKSSISATGEILLTIDATGDVDAGTAGNQAAVRINVTLPVGGLTINTGDMFAAKSNGLGVAVTNMSSKILNNMAITVGAGSLMDLTLGNEVAVGGHMIDINTAMTGGLTISGFSLNDAGGAVSGGSIAATTIKVCDTGVATCTVTNTLSFKANVDISAGASGGMIFTTTQVGTLAGGADIEITAAKLGSAATATIGNIDIIGLNMANTAIRIAGH